MLVAYMLSVECDQCVLCAAAHCTHLVIYYTVAELLLTRCAMLCITDSQATTLLALSPLASDVFVAFDVCAFGR
jgi:hypothetical protein